jgi:hypothetical protein
LAVEIKVGLPPHVESSGPKTKKLIVPVAESPPLSVAVSEIDPPNKIADDAWVVKVGAALTTVVPASALSFSELGSDDEVTEAMFE